MSLLSEDEIEAIYNVSLRALEDTGVKVMSEKAQLLSSGWEFQNRQTPLDS